MTNRRQFLQTITAASLLLPKGLLARSPEQTFHFIHVDTLNSWPVTDPVAWCLENADQPILERASERLVKLTPEDAVRIIRPVVRRCSLNLLEIHPGQVVTVPPLGNATCGDVRHVLPKTHGSQLDRRSKSYCRTEEGSRFTTSSTATIFST